MLIGYARVSTAGDRQSLDLQLDALRDAGCKEPYVFSDYASGVDDNRPRLKQALEALRPGDTFVVWKLDRFGRSLSHLVNTLHELHGREVNFKSITENIDTTTPAGRLLYGMIAAVAQFERELLQERVRAGMEASARRGTKFGRPKVLSDETLTAIRRHMAALPDLSQRDLAKAFNVKISTLRSALKRPAVPVVATKKRGNTVDLVDYIETLNGANEHE